MGMDVCNLLAFIYNNQIVKLMIENPMKSEYEAPQVEILEARVERGFAVSGGQQDGPVENPGSTLSGYGSNGEAQFS